MKSYPIAGRNTRVALAAAACVLWATTAAQAQAQVLLKSSWTRLPPRKVKVIGKHSIVSVLMDEKTRVISEAELDREKKAHGKLILKDWLLLRGLPAMTPDPRNPGDPSIWAEMDIKVKSDGSIEASESMRLRIACHVEDTTPNDNFVLEGHRQLRVHDEVWSLSLTGIIRPEDVLANNTVLSENVADLLVHLSGNASRENTPQAIDPAVRCDASTRSSRNHKGTPR